MSELRAILLFSFAISPGRHSGKLRSLGQGTYEMALVKRNSVDLYRRISLIKHYVKHSTNVVKGIKCKALMYMHVIAPEMRAPPSRL